MVFKHFSESEIKMDESSCQTSDIVFTWANSYGSHLAVSREFCDCFSCFDLTQPALKNIDLLE